MNKRTIQKLTILLSMILLLGLLTGCTGGANLGGMLGGMTGPDDAEEFVDPNELTEIVEVTGVPQAYDAGEKYQFTWEDMKLELSLSTTDNTCYFTERTPFGNNAAGYGAYEKVTYYVGTYVPGETEGTVVCTFQDCLQGVIPGEDYNTSVIADAIESMKKKGHYDDFQYAKEMALYIDGKTLRTHMEGSVKGTLEATLDAGKFTPNMLEVLTGLTMAYRMGFQTDSYFVADINGYGILCRDNWYNYDGVRLSSREYDFTQNQNSYKIWFDTTYYPDGKLKSTTDYENNIPYIYKEYNQNEEVVYALRYDENGQPYLSHYFEGNLTKEIDHTMFLVNDMTMAKWINENNRTEKVVLYDAQGNVLIEHKIRTAGEYLEVNFAMDWETDLCAGFSCVELFAVNGKLMESISYDCLRLTGKDVYDGAGNLKTTVIYDENGQEVCVLNVVKEGNRISQYSYNEKFAYMIECDGNNQNMGFSTSDLKGNVKYSAFVSTPENTFDVEWNVMEETTYYLVEKDANGNEINRTHIDAYGNVGASMQPHTPGYTIHGNPGHTETLTFYKEQDANGEIAAIYFYDQNGNEVYGIHLPHSDLEVGYINTDLAPWIEHFQISSENYKFPRAEVYVSSDNIYIWEYVFRDSHDKEVVLKDINGNVYFSHQVTYVVDEIHSVSWSTTLQCYVVSEHLIMDPIGDTAITIYRPDGTKVAAMYTSRGNSTISLGYTGDGTAYLMEIDEDGTLVKQEVVEY